MRSLRSRLVVGTLLGITLCLALNGALVFASVRSRRYRDLDRSLETLVHSIVPFAVAEFARSGRPWARLPRADGEAPGPAAAFRAPGTYYHGWLADGETLIRSETLGELELPPLTDELRTVVFATVDLPDGARGRAAGLRVRLDRGRFARDRMRRRDERPRRPRAPDSRGERPGRPALPDGPPLDGGDPRRDDGDRPAPPADEDRPPVADLVVALDTTELEADLAELRWMLVLGWLTSSLGCALILMWVVGRSLRPVDGLRRQLAALDEGGLDHRFQVANTPSELVPVVDQLNALMGRLGAAFEREQTLTAHAAHELRTPLTGLRSTLEVCLNRPRETAEYREAARDCLDITLGMQAMVERLLELNRRTEPRIEEAPLAELVEEAWEPFAERARERGLTLAAGFDDGLVARTDLEGLSRVLANLLENAVSYADEGGAVAVTADAGATGLRFAVANPARSAPADAAERAFDAFWRADSARTDVGVHAGLGLSLCRRIVETLGGRIGAELVDGRFRVEVTLPPA